VAFPLFTRAAKFPDDRIGALDNWRIIAAINDRHMTAALVQPSALL
jgi:hypothetical protein